MPGAAASSAVERPILRLIRWPIALAMGLIAVWKLERLLHRDGAAIDHRACGLAMLGCCVVIVIFVQLQTPPGQNTRWLARHVLRALMLTPVVFLFYVFLNREVWTLAAIIDALMFLLGEGKRST